jgi:hypothetical protein
MCDSFVGWPEVVSTVNISSISVIGANAEDFAQTNTCGTSVAAGASCSI